MRQDIIIPPLGESVTEGTIAHWLKKVGDIVKADETVVELETDKITLEINAPMAGVLEKISHDKGAVVSVGDAIGIISDKASTASVTYATAESAKPMALQTPTSPSTYSNTSDDVRLKMSPAVTKMVAETGVDPQSITGTGKDGRLTKGDIQQQLNQPQPIPTVQPNSSKIIEIKSSVADQSLTEREQRLPMTRLRQRIAERLKDAQNTAAMLTTFNEVDMTNLMAMRVQYKDAFEKKYGVRLGFMSAFVKASLVALKEIPAVNAEINGEDLVYKKYYDIGVAVSAPNGLVVPVIRDADKLGFAAIEKAIQQLGLKAKENKLALTDLTGGTFTITNGGVFGSLMSTPIINPPQSGILGMHKIQERPVAVAGKVEIRPMMYIALTYDHRIIDGREAVTFLVRVKECIENPERILLDI